MKNNGKRSPHLRAEYRELIILGFRREIRCGAAHTLLIAITIAVARLRVNSLNIALELRGKLRTIERVEDDISPR